MINKYTIEKFVRFTEPLNSLKTKFGGQPVWITEPQWPLSSGWDNRPMMFVGQIELDKELFDDPSNSGSASDSAGSEASKTAESGADQEQRIAYIFVTHSVSGEEGFFDPDIIDPDGGENAVIIQPGGKLLVKTVPLENGPTLWDDNGQAYEGRLQLKQEQDPDFIDSESYLQLSEDEQRAYSDVVDGDKIGGVPYFFQGDGWPDDSRWHLLLQLHANFKPFSLNIGSAPTLFVFVSEDLTTGKLVIQDS
ncbi:hypothetical protein [Paenibacillus nasutitermitis]|uniref:DUF1963 domain-containing protein n=1 Tax=Paenibacillus nasutitermitis TaxID=1652958 RepID=A0A916YK11_9BACL|nr:hypothetical protein [Paenibacillus nasutitermitis]GGD46852.1 hypothetical protein GCM10010911_00460 [Paenibacillus nasutitermitis]